MLTLIFMLQSGVVFIQLFILRRNQETLSFRLPPLNHFVIETKLNKINALQPAHNLRKTDISELLAKV